MQAKSNLCFLFKPMAAGHTITLDRVEGKPILEKVCGASPTLPARTKCDFQWNGDATETNMAGTGSGGQTSWPLWQVRVRSTRTPSHYHCALRCENYANYSGVVVGYAFWLKAGRQESCRCFIDSDLDNFVPAAQQTTTDDESYTLYRRVCSPATSTDSSQPAVGPTPP